MAYRIRYGGRGKRSWKWVLAALMVLAIGMTLDRDWYTNLARYVGGCIRAYGG